VIVPSNQLLMPSHENEKKKSEQRRQKVSKDMVCRSANAQGVG